MATDNHYTGQTSPKTKAIDSWIRDEAITLITKKKTNLSSSQKKLLETLSQKLKALALLSDNSITPTHACKICNGKGRIQIRKGKGSNGKWTWEQEACWCIWRKVKPTDVTDLKYIEGEPAKADEPVPEIAVPKSEEPTKPIRSKKSPRKRPAKV